MCLSLGCSCMGRDKESVCEVLAWVREGGVMLCLCVVSLDLVCRWQVSVYCARRIPAHLMFTQC